MRVPEVGEQGCSERRREGGVGIGAPECLDVHGELVDGIVDGDRPHVQHGDSLGRSLTDLLEEGRVGRHGASLVTIRRQRLGSADLGGHRIIDLETHLAMVAAGRDAHPHPQAAEKSP